MPPYHYVALNQEQKELSGVIEATSEPVAREKLNALHLSVVSLNPVEAFSHGGKTPDKKIFSFEALDKNGKKVTGTIAAQDPFKAFSRLFEEYQLNVLALADGVASGAQEDMGALRSAYEKLAGAARRKQEDEQQAEKTLQAQKRELLQKVDFTMARVQEFLKKFSAELKPQQRDTIQSYIDQLLRIKDSTNLDHIRATCEKMLGHIQHQELFLHEEQRLKESAKLKVETTELLDQLKNTGLKREIDVVGMVASLRDRPFFKPLADGLLKFLKAQNPEIRKQLDEIRAVNRHLREYLKLFIFGKAGAARREAWEGMLALRSEKKRLKLKLKALRLEEKKTRASGAPDSAAGAYAASALGWILAFYLMSYMIAYPFTIKNFGLPGAALPKGFYFYHSPLLKSVTLLLFLAYGAAAVRHYWLNPSWSALVLYPATLLGFLLIVINLM